MRDVHWINAGNLASLLLRDQVPIERVPRVWDSRLLSLLGLIFGERVKRKPDLETSSLLQLRLAEVMGR